MLSTSSSIFPIRRAGTPATTEPGGKERVTTALAPTTVWWPILTPLQITTPAPSQTLFPILTGAAT
ncbi:MAG TPA: acetyltransferase [Cyanobacteria bacterium UBA8530]|nr:acetyltransferase [Cyanobacteria bacterium UBA8530]